KCLAKKPNERYATAGELADDLRRWLADQTIRAKPPSLRQKAAKWARRHKYLVRSAGAVVSVAVAALAGSNYGIWRQGIEVRAAYGREARERGRAQDNLLAACDAIELMLSRLGEQRLANVPQMETVRAQVLQDALRLHQRLLQVDDQDPVARFQAAR